jgi:hypothetical protein
MLGVDFLMRTSTLGRPMLTTIRQVPLSLFLLEESTLFYCVSAAQKANCTAAAFQPCWQPVRLPDPSLCAAFFAGNLMLQCAIVLTLTDALLLISETLSSTGAEKREYHKSFRLVVSPVGTFFYIHATLSYFRGRLWRIKILKANSAVSWLGGRPTSPFEWDLPLACAYIKKEWKRSCSLRCGCADGALAAHERSISHANCSCSKPHSSRTILLQLQLCAQSAPSYHAQPFISLFSSTALLRQILKKAVTLREEILGQFSLPVNTTE